MINRLHLDFQIENIEDRKRFLDKYIQKEEFQKKPLSEEELETCANYILWGRDKDGKNCVQKKEIQIKTKNGTWDKQEDESLDALLETPTFNENEILRAGNIPKKVSREIFDRKRALKECPSDLVKTYQELFQNIDSLDLILNYYDLAHGKRKNPPREELLNKFTKEEQDALQEESTHLNQYQYLKKRHLLVEMRRQQFTLKDSYTTMVQRHTPPLLEGVEEILVFDEDIEVLPLGVKDNQKIHKLIFKRHFNPEEYTEEELSIISKFLWEKKSIKTGKVLDFRELEHVYNFFLMYTELEDAALLNLLESETNALLKTLRYYISKAELSEVQKEILSLKMKRQKNQEIADYINKKYNKTYTANYISTIFRQKIIKQINEAAKAHLEIIENIFFPENFKKCSCCGETLLRNADNFVRKSRAKDGFSNRCKKCDKAERIKKKNQ